MKGFDLFAPDVWSEEAISFVSARYTCTCGMEIVTEHDETYESWEARLRMFLDEHSLCGGHTGLERPGDTSGKYFDC